MPTRKTGRDPLAVRLDRRSVEVYLDELMQDRLGVEESLDALEEALPPASAEMESPTEKVTTRYEIYPVIVWVDPGAQETLRERLKGEWLTCTDALKHPHLSLVALA